MGNGLLQLVQDLEWLGREISRPMVQRRVTESGPAAFSRDFFLERQRSIIATANKIERELLLTVRFDPTRLVGIGCPVEETLDSVVELIAALEEIKQDAVAAPDKLPAHIHLFNRRVEEYLDGSLPSAA